MPAVIEEELWFGGHDPRAAEDTAARSMAALVGRIVGAKPFPESARRLAELTRKDVIRIEPIIQVLERDPALSARLLRLVNSAGYALRQRCTSVRHAATLVGTDRLHQIATTAAVLDLFDSRGPIAARIVEHSTIVGAFCRYLGAHLALPVDDLFTAGFLHDIGKLMLLETEGDQYVQLLEKYAEQPDTIHVAERSLYGFDHAVLAAHVLNNWNIPDPVPKIVAWHHDPTRAYGISSMMAALVQTVRLADAAVCAMVRGVEQSEFATLAGAESASYLDISEPQLASMWDELQTLYRESVEQCRGENAPALDPRSLRPKQPLSVAAAAQEPPRSTELPLQFPCVVCGGPTFGNTCSACGGHMCPDHMVGREDWCSLCARDYHHESSEAPAAMSPRLAAVIGVATFVVSVAFGYETGGTEGAVRAGIGTCMLLALAAVLTVIGRRWLLRFKFVRTRPNRNILEALENDGGVHSLVPPTLAQSDGDATSAVGRDPLSEHIRLSGAMVERVMINDVPSIPAIIAPKPFDGLKGSSILCEPMPALEAPPNPPPPAALASASYDDHRVMMQSMSLVTIPAPASPSVSFVSSRTDSASGSLPDSCELGAIQPSPIEVPKGDESPISTSAGQTPERLVDEKAAVAYTPAHGSAPSQGFDRDAMGERAETKRDAPADAEDTGGQHLRRTSEDTDERGTTEIPDEFTPPNTSVHPLAALGIHPARNNSRRTEHQVPKRIDPAPTEAVPEAAQVQQTDDSTAVQNQHADLPTANSDAAYDRPHSERTTLLGLNSSEPSLSPSAVNSAAQESAASADVVNQPEAASAVNEPIVRHSSVPVHPSQPPESEIVPLAQMLRKSEPPPRTSSVPAPPLSPKATAQAEQLLEPIAAAIGSEMLAKLGPDFKAKVMDLVAQRIAETVAEQMLQSLGQSSVPSRRPRARATTSLVPDSDVPDAKLPVKRQRKRIGKH
jgi:HD-like signal output (HDOD) protein